MALSKSGSVGSARAPSEMKMAKLHARLVGSRALGHRRRGRRYRVRAQSQAVIGSLCAAPGTDAAPPWHVAARLGLLLRVEVGRIPGARLHSRRAACAE